MGIKIDIKAKDLKTLLALLQQYLPNTLVWAFGSRVKFTSKPASDLDLVAFITEKQKMSFSLLKDSLVESTLPFRVDLHDWNDIPENFRKNIEDSYLVIQDIAKRELPSDWKTYTLGKDVVSKLGDGLHGTPIYDDNGEYYFINGSNLVAGKIVINSNTKKVSEEEFIKYKKELSERTILLGINGTIGNVALYNNEKCILGKSSAYLNINDDFDKNFVRYVLTNEHFQNYIKNNASGTTIKNVGLGLLREYEFLAPEDKTEQFKIAQILSSLDDKIELNIQMNQTLEAMAQAIFKEWCCVDEGIIPEGWVWKKLSDIADVSSSKRIFREEYTVTGVPFYRGKEITQLSKGEAISTELFISEERYYDIKEKFGIPLIGDILITSVGTIGSIWIVDNDLPFYFKDGNVTWVNEYLTEIKGEFIYQWLKTKEAKEQIKSITIGSTQEALTISALKGLNILIPNNETVTKVGYLLKEINSRRVNNIIQIQTLTQTRDTLLPKLMRGKIEIKN